jgi:hypothetical protein
MILIGKLKLPIDFFVEELSVTGAVLCRKIIHLLSTNVAWISQLV